MKTYDAQETADYLKTDVTTIRALIDDGKLPAAKIGRAYVIREDDLDDYLMQKVREQTAERIERVVGEGGRTRNKSEASRITRYRSKTLPILPELPGQAATS